MIVRDTGRSFEPCPEFTGRAVCVDVTPLKRTQSAYGERDVFRLVFEIDLAREDGSPWCVWSQPFTASLHEKAGLRKFLRQWLGRDLTPQELGGLDLESLVGRSANLVVIHEAGDDGQTFDRIAACTPDRSGNPLAPSGRYVRVKDRPPRDGALAAPSRPAPPASASRTASAPPPAAALQPADELARLAAVIVHVGRHRGKRFDELTDQDIDALAQHWLPTALGNVNSSPADRALANAIQWVVRQRQATADDVPF